MLFDAETDGHLDGLEEASELVGSKPKPIENPKVPHPPCPVNNKVLRKGGLNKCLLDTPFGTQFIRCPHPRPHRLGPKQLRSERKCSLAKAFVEHGGRGGT